MDKRVDELILVEEELHSHLSEDELEEENEYSGIESALLL